MQIFFIETLDAPSSPVLISAQRNEPDGEMAMTVMNWTWKVFVRPDGSADFLPTEEPTDFKVVYENLPLRDAMALSDELNAGLIA